MMGNYPYLRCPFCASRSVWTVLNANWTRIKCGNCMKAWDA